MYKEGKCQGGIYHPPIFVAYMSLLKGAVCVLLLSVLAKWCLIIALIQCPC